MNQDFQRLMTEATLLTRGGQLHAATQAIQRALHGGVSEAFAPGNAPVSPPGRHAERPTAAPAGLILDGLTRFVDEPANVAQAEPAPAAARPLAPSKGSDEGVHYVEPPAAPQARGPQPERWLDGRFTHQGRTLAYKLFVPAVPAEANPAERPLLVMLHGCTQGAADFAAGTQMNALAREHGVVVLYPEQTQHANAQKCWNWFKPQHQQRGRGEPAVLAALAQAITAEYNVDAARVYVAGLSAGGAMADIAGRCYPDVFAAVGVHSGLPSGAASDLVSALAAMRGAGPKSRRAGPVPPTIVFHGDADNTVHESNGSAIMEAARQASEMAGDARPSASSAGHSARGQRFTRTVYSDAEGRTSVEYWQLHGAGHAWSGGSAKGSYTDPAGVDASAEMLRFFLESAPGRAVK